MLVPQGPEITGARRPHAGGENPRQDGRSSQPSLWSRRCATGPAKGLVRHPLGGSVPDVYDAVYDASRSRIGSLVTALSPAELDTVVPGTPAWNGRQVVAHVAGVAADVVDGRMAGWPGAEWTSAQVREREGRSLEVVLAEWAGTAAAVCAGIAQRRIALPIVHDVLTHEADLREAFGRGALPAPAVDAALAVLVRLVLRRVDGLLMVRAGEHEWRAEGVGPPAVVTAEPYELFRGLMSRRSRVQMRAWDWAGDVEAYVDALPVFGSRDDDQPLP